MGRKVSLREKIGEKCLLGRKVLGRNVLGRKDFWGETSEYHHIKSVFEFELLRLISYVHDFLPDLEIELIRLIREKN